MAVKQNKWKIIVDRWEDDSTQTHLTYFMDSINRDYENEPYVEQIFDIIAAFVATIYCNAYSYDNITRVLYTKYARQMKSFNELSGKELIKQEEQFMKILKTMPQGFKDYSHGGGVFLNVPEGTPLTVNKADQFIDYIQSPKFREILTRIIISDVSKSVEKSR